jgi:hypothetical protein
MRQRRSHPRRPLRHAVRLVDFRVNRAQYAGYEARLNALEVGLCAADVLIEHFPAFAERTGLTGIPVTNGKILGCCAALWQLTEQEKGIELRWAGESYGVWTDGLARYQCEADPAETLRMFSDAADEFLGEIGHFVFSPQPAYFGYGVEELLDHESDNFPSSPLTLALWHLFNATPLGLGIDVSTMAANIEQELAFDILRIKRLPPSTPIATLCSLFKLPVAKQYGVEVQDLIAYPAAKTRNPLANNSDYEVEAIYMGEMNDQWDWSQLDELAALSQGANRIAEAYSDWDSQVKTIEDVRKLAGRLHKACRAAERELTQPKTLADILFDQPQTVEDRRLAWAERRLLEDDEQLVEDEEVAV